MKPTRSTLFFDFLESHPYIVLLVLVLAQTAFSLHGRALWFSDEVRYADVLTNVLAGKHWLVLSMNGEFYPDKPPVYFWLLKLLSALTGSTDVPWLLMLGSSVSGLLFVWAACWLAREADPEQPETGLISGMLLQSCLFVLGMLHYGRMDLLFAALITASTACLYRGIQRDELNAWIPLGFLAASLATLTKGPLGIILPLLSLTLFALWSGRARRLLRRDTLLGVGLMLLPLLLWIAAAWYVEGSVFMRKVFIDQIWLRAVKAWHHEEPWSYYLPVLPLCFLPWSFLLLFTPVWRVALPETWGGVIADRKDASGAHFLGIAFLSGFTLLTLVSTKIPVYLLPLLAPLAAIAARRLLALRPVAAERFWRLVSVFFLLAALAAPLFELVNPWSAQVRGMGLSTIVLALAAIALCRLSRQPAVRPLLALCLLLALWVVPLAKVTLPSLDNVLSPKAQSLKLAALAEQGYEPLAYKVYEGIYSYYAGRPIQHVNSEESLKAALDENPKRALAMPKKRFEDWKDRPENLKVVHEQWIMERRYVLAVPGE